MEIVIARVLNNVVINIEVADEKWISANNPGEDGSILVPYYDNEIPYIGLGWSEETGFEQPVTEDPNLNAALDGLESVD